MHNAQLSQLGLFDLILQAGLVGKSVLLLLVAASVFSWTVIFSKWQAMKAVAKENTSFLDIFWHGKSIDEIYTKSEKFARSPTASVFKSGFRELKKLTGDSQHLDSQSIDNIYRALLRSSSAEISTLEKHLGWLATIASAAPFVGLFGTVWGIMNSFQSIGATGAASLAVVAPGISEALITTAFGIGTAIPAVIAYNHFAGMIKKVAVDMDCFSQDFLNIVQRSVMGTASKKG